MPLMTELVELDGQAYRGRGAAQMENEQKQQTV